MEKPSPMTITLAVSIPDHDYRALLETLVDAVVDDVPNMTDRVSDAVTRAQLALDEGVQ